MRHAPPGRRRGACPCWLPKSSDPGENRGRPVCRQAGRRAMAAAAAALLLLLRGDHHHHLPALEAGPGLDDDVVAKIALDLLGHLAAKRLVAHPAAPEAHVGTEPFP